MFFECKAVCCILFGIDFELYRGDIFGILGICDEKVIVVEGDMLCGGKLSEGFKVECKLKILVKASVDGEEAKFSLFGVVYYGGFYVGNAVTVGGFVGVTFGYCFKDCSSAVV